MFIRLPPRAIFAHYAPDPDRPGEFQVVTPKGQILAASFYELRDRFAFVCQLAGIGAWCVLVPLAADQQPSLF